MAQANKTFRIFVSSTFNDLKAERNTLQKQVFPRLRDLCLRHGCRFQAIDLRWGVSEEAALDQQTMKICLEEINRSQQTSPRPNFIILLGNRYGWRPLPAEIPTGEFEKIERLAADDSERELLRRWYHRDDNAIPAIYCLRAREVHFEDSQSEEEQMSTRRTEAEEWAGIEKKLRRVVCSGVEQLSLSHEERMIFEASATEQEIENGALKVVDAQDHVFGFFRELDQLPPVESGSEFIDLDDHEASQARLDNLKDRLRSHVPGNIRTYPVRIEGRGMSADHLPQLCEDVYAALSRVILAEIDKLVRIDPLDKEVAEHENFGRDRARVFIGRAEYLEKLNRYLRDQDPHPMAIIGRAGSGKSALLAKAIAEYGMQNTDHVIVSRFIGATPDSTDGGSLLRSLCEEIKRRFGDDQVPVPTEYQKLVEDFPRRLGLATAAKPLIIFLDALDQLSDKDQAGNLIWFPSTLPQHVRLVVSALSPSESLIHLNRKLRAEDLVELQPMTDREGDLLLDLWLKEAGRDLQPLQRAEVLDRFKANGLPLWLKLAFEEARKWRSYSPPRNLEGDIPGLVRGLLRRLSSIHGEVLVRQSLGYLSAARNGLSEDELLDILSADEEVMQFFLSRAHDKPPERKLPVVVWARLFSDLEAYLAERSADGANLMSFYHRQFGEVVSEDYTAGARGVELHRQLAQYFGSQPLQTEKEGKQIGNLRKLAELPYQQTHGQLWTKLAATLCSLKFLQTKVGEELVYDVINDYEIALTPKPSIDRFEELPSDVGDLLGEFAAAFNQEFHAFKDYRETAAQQLFNNLFAKNGYQGAQGTFLAAFSSQSDYPGRLPWLQRLNVAPQTSTSRELIRTLDAHDGPVTALVVSPGGEWIASGGADGRLKIWRERNGELLSSLFAHEGGIFALAWLVRSPGQDLVVTAGRDQYLRIWDWRSERELKNWRPQGGQIRALASLNPQAIGSESDFVSSGDDKVIRGWNSETGREVWSLRGHLDRVFCVSAAAGGATLVSGGEDRTVRLWGDQFRRELRTFRSSRDRVRCVALEPEAAWAVSGGDDQMLRILQLRSGSELVAQGHRGRINCLGIGRRSGSTNQPEVDGRPASASYFIASGSDDDTVRIWDSRTGEELALLRGHNGPVEALSVDPVGEWVASGGEDGTLRFWKVNPGNREITHRQTGLEHNARINSLISVPGREIIASGSDDATIKLWYQANGDHSLTLRGHLGPVNCLIAYDDSRLVSGSNDWTVRVWNIRNGEPINTLGRPYHSEPAGVLSAITSTSARRSGHQNAVTSLARFGDHLLLSGSQDCSVRLWDIGSSDELRQYNGARGPIERLLVCQETGLVMALGSGREIPVWNVDQSEPVRWLAGHTSRITAAEVVRSQLLVTASLDRSVRVWNPISGLQMRALTGHSQAVTCLAADAGGRFIASGGRDNQICLWEIDGNDQPRIFTGHTDCVQGIILDSVAGRMWSYADDQWLIRWDIENGKVISRAHLDAQITSMLQISDQEIFLGTKRGGLALLRPA